MLAYCLFSAKVVFLPQTNRIIMALPIDFITRTRALLGEEFDRLEAALSADVPVSIRINPMKGTSAPKAGAPVAWCESGFYLPERLSFTFDPLFHAAHKSRQRTGSFTYALIACSRNMEDASCT